MAGQGQAGEDTVGLRDIKCLNADGWGAVGLMTELWGRWTAERRELWVLSNGIPGFSSAPSQILSERDSGVGRGGAHVRKLWQVTLLIWT